MIKKYKLAIIGATGLVGRTILKILEEKNLNNFEYFLFSSNKSAGTKLKFLKKDYIVKELTKDTFNTSFHFAVFATNTKISKKYIPIATSTGCIVIDNSSAFRMEPTVPLIVPEINLKNIKPYNKIISNPNCSTIQAVLPLKVLNDNFKLKRVIISTYQSVSGAGINGIKDLKNGAKNKKTIKFPYPIYNNCLPHIDDFLPNGYTKEEAKIINETRKILNTPNLPITSTAVRIPILNSHSESINVELEKDFNLKDINNLFNKFPGITVLDDIKNNIYPTALNATNSNEVFVGRIRRDFSIRNGLNMWVVSDNIRKGAAYNAIQILENIIKT